MISEGSSDTKDWSNDWHHSDNSSINTILQYYCLYSIFDQVNAGWVRIRDFLTYRPQTFER